MGFGDELIGTGMARGAHARGKRVAFGDGQRIIWGPHAAEIFRGNPNIAPPGSEGAADLEWVAHYKGRRAYNRPGGNGWIWNYDFKPTPGEMFFDETEQKLRRTFRDPFVLIEPNVPNHKGVAPNKQRPFERYQETADLLRQSGHRIVQLIYDGAVHRISGASFVQAFNFRSALAILSGASLFIGPEGGLHHGAAAVWVRAVVIFGGFIPPQVTGYDSHANIAAGGEACGSVRACEHCRQAMASIKVGRVFQAAMEMLYGEPIRTVGRMGDGTPVAAGSRDRGVRGADTPASAAELPGA